MTTDAPVRAAAPWRTVALGACALATAMGTAITTVNIFNHLSHWNAPKHQQIIVQMLVLVIVWSLFSFFVVIRPGMQPITMVAMDTYEAYIVLLFTKLITVYLVRSPP